MMYHHQNSRRATMNNSNEGSRRNTFVEQRQDQSSNQAGTNPDSEKEEQQNKQPEHSHSYRVLAPNDKKRRELIQQRERNMQYYEEVKASNRMKYDSEGPKKIGGSKVSQDDVLEKRIKDQKRAEALEKRKSYEQKKKREKWAAEKKSVEEKEIMERKLRARAQTERNEEKRRQEEIAKKKRYDAEMRRRWQDVGDDDMGRKGYRVYRSGAESNPSTDELREVYARRYGSSQIEEPSSDRIQVRNCVHQALQRRTTDNLQASPYEECLDRFSNLNTEEDTSLSESEQDEDIRKLCQMFPCVERELIEDIYAQTNNSLANSRAILSTS